MQRIPISWDTVNARCRASFKRFFPIYCPCLDKSTANLARRNIGISYGPSPLLTRSGTFSFNNSNSVGAPMITGPTPVQSRGILAGRAPTQVATTG